MLSEAQIFELLQGSAMDQKSSLIDRSNFDDAALIPIDEVRSLAISTDFIRGTRFNMFEAGHMSFTDLAYYLVASNVSDIEAMGAKPAGFLDVFRYPQGTDESVQVEFLKALKAASRYYGTTLIGGDTGTFVEFVMTGTAFGFVETAKALRRCNARPGDKLCFSGNLGLSRAAQVYFLSDHAGTSLADDGEALLLNAWRRPSPPLGLGPALVASELRVAAQDASDGFSTTVRSICEASTVGAVIDGSKLPIHEVVAEVARHVGRNVFDLALSTSPDFGLLFSAAPDEANTIVAKDPSIHIVGDFCDGTEISFVLGDEEGPLPGDHWSQDHFSV